jgi:uncharacterized protein YrrD
MTAQPEVVRQSDLLNQLVLDRQALEELGRLEVLWMYPQRHRVLGFICKSGFLGTKKAAFKLAQIEALGESGILIHGQPEATTADKVRQLVSLIGLEVWSDSGNRIGKITDCLFHLQTGEITHYLFVSNGWAGITGEVYQLPPRQILSFGKSRVLVADSASSTFTVYQQGLTQKLTKAGDLLKEEGRSIAQQAEAVTEQAKGRLHHLSEQARERALWLSEQARQRAQALNEQLQAETQTLVERAKETSQTMAEQVKEQTQTLSKQVEAGIQTLTIQAEEIFETAPAPDASAKTSPDATQQDATQQDDRPSPNSNAIEDDAIEDDEPWLDLPDTTDLTVLEDDDEPWLDLPETPNQVTNPVAADDLWNRPSRPAPPLEDDDDEPWI